MIEASEQAAQLQRAIAFVQRYADALSCKPARVAPSAKRLLIIGGGASSRVETELCLIKGLERAGCRPIVLIAWYREALRHYYNLLPANDVHDLLRDFCDRDAFRAEADAILSKCASLNELLPIRRRTVRIGGHAVSSARRHLAIGTIDPQLPEHRAVLGDCLANSLATAAAAARIIEELRPSVILTEDTAYTPRGEILDTAVAAGIPVIRWYAAHKSGALMLKRYTSSNRNDDINSLSRISWQILQQMDWGNKGELLERELRATYLSGDWYNEDGAQYGKTITDVETVRTRLHLLPSRKTAFIFPHIGWDASFGRGEDLFHSYDEWLIATVKAASASSELQWIIRVHPAHAGKVDNKGKRGRDEADTLLQSLGALPPHVNIIPAESDLSTFSLFPVMDYCITVRGTVGLEAACRGIPVITGGTGRYDGKGFTIDSTTSDEYLRRIFDIGNVPRLTPTQIELAQRFAYGLFLLRPLPLPSVELVYDKKSNRENLNSLVKINIAKSDDWDRAGDLTAFANWVLNSTEEDFLLPVCEPQLLQSDMLGRT